MRASIFAAAAALAAVSGATLADAAPGPSRHVATPGDPLERYNRIGFMIEGALDRYLVGPIAGLYRAMTPGVIGQGLHNLVTNFSEPMVIVNDTLQLRPKRVAVASARFVLNTTLGAAGLVDVAGKSGLPYRDSTFGDTLARYRVPAGPYLFVPLIGPSTTRDAVGSGIDLAFDPLHFVNYPHRTAVSIGLAAVGGLDLRNRSRDQFKALMIDAADPYATLRSAYLQNRRGETQGARPDGAELPSLEDPDAPNPPTSEAAKPGGVELPPLEDPDAPKPPPTPLTPEPAPPGPGSHF